MARAVHRLDPMNQGSSRYVRHLTWLLVGLVGLAASVVACGDEDDDGSSSSSSSGSPQEAGTSSGSSGSSSGSSSGGPADADADAPVDASTDALARPTYGVFFTAQHYRADFAREIPLASRRAFVDDICQLAADAAGLGGRYQAALAITETTLGPALLPDARFCPVHAGVATCTEDETVFTSSLGVLSDPLHVLTTDQTGAASNASSKFLSGLSVGPDDGNASRTCSMWSSNDSDDGSAGVGTVVPGSGGAFGSWYTGSEACTEVERPLLCVGVGSSFGPGADN